MPKTRKKRIFIIAGEASGDLLGAKLMDSLRYFNGSDIEFCGVGGENMAEQGLESIFPMRDIALMGFAEVLPHAWRIMCRLKETCDAILAFEPDILVTIDSPGFTFRVTKWVRESFGRTVTCIHYVAPTVWAYKAERAKKTAELFDHLMVLLPFEARYFEAHGLNTSFIGHPIVDDLHHVYAPPRICEDGKPLHVALFPGSRKGEVERLLPIFKDTVNLLREVYPNIQVTIPINEMVLPYLHVRDWEHAPSIVVGEESRIRVMREAHIALAKTGTVTLEIAKYGLPIVATYKVNALTASMLRRMLKIPYVNLINIIAGREIIGELMQEQCNPAALHAALCTLLQEPKAAMQQSYDAFNTLKKMINPDDVLASDAAAQIVMSYL